MSRTMTGAADRRATKDLIASTTAGLAGKPRGRDREVRRDSYDVDDARAKPHARIGDGSVAQGLAHREALLRTAEELVHQDWKENPADRARAAGARRIEVVAELRRYADGEQAAAGRPAALRQELQDLEAVIARYEGRLTRLDVVVLRGLLRFVDFATGQLFPSLDTIAAAAACHRNSVIRSLRRLKAKGFFDWVRRSVKTSNEGQFAPQREQTSNAYFFDHRRGMAQRTWSRFQQILVAKLRRLGAVPSGVDRGPAEVTHPALKGALESFAARLTNAST